MAVQKLFAVVGVIGTISGLLSMGGCRPQTPVPQNAVISYRLTEEPDSLDPQIAESPSAKLIVTNLFEGLVRENAQGQLIPGVAKDWKVSSDKTVYTFTLRDNAVWNNGDPVTAEDFLFGLSRTLDPATDSGEASVLYAIKNAEAIHQGQLEGSALGVYAEGRRLIIELTYPDPHFLQALTQAAAMPCQKSFFMASGGQYGREPDKILSNGAFCVEKYGWIHGTMLSLRRNPAYHGTCQPNSLGVDITFGDTPDNVCQAILNGTTDCYALSGEEVRPAAQRGLTLTESGTVVWGILFQTQDSLLQSSALRQALLCGLDRSFILQKLPAKCTASDHLIPDTMLFDGRSYREQAPNNLYLAYNAHAKEQFQKVMQSLSLRKLPKLTILCPDDASTQVIVNNIIQSWNELTGSYINKEPVPAAQLHHALQTGRYQIVIAPITPPQNCPEGLLSLFSSDRHYPLSGLSDEHYDRLLRSLRTADRQQAFKSMVQAEKYLLENGIVCPLYTEKRYFAAAPNITGLLFYPDERGIDFLLAQKNAP